MTTARRSGPLGLRPHASAPHASAPHAKGPLARGLLAAGLVAATLSGCSGIRAMTRGAMNSERTDVPAPALAGDAWVGATPDLEGRWYLVAFLKPT